MQAPLTKAELNALHVQAIEADRKGRISFAFKRICDEVKRHASAGKKSLQMAFDHSSDVREDIFDRLVETFPDSKIGVVPAIIYARDAGGRVMSPPYDATLTIDWTM